MMMDPLPDRDKAFSILIQQERQQNLQFVDTRVIAQFDTNNNGSSRGRGQEEAIVPNILILVVEVEGEVLDFVPIAIGQDIWRIHVT